MIKILFEEGNLMNLDIFLDRVPLKGKSEAAAMVAIMDKISKGERVQEKKEGDK